jgi:hypothetical protein
MVCVDCRFKFTGGILVAATKKPKQSYKRRLFTFDIIEERTLETSAPKPIRSTGNFVANLESIHFRSSTPESSVPSSYHHASDQRTSERSSLSSSSDPSDSSLRSDHQSRTAMRDFTPSPMIRLRQRYDNALRSRTDLVPQNSDENAQRSVLVRAHSSPLRGRVYAVNANHRLNSDDCQSNIDDHTVVEHQLSVDDCQSIDDCQV